MQHSIDFSLWMKSCDMTVHSTKIYWAVLSCCIMLYKVVLTFECVEEILKCDHSNESHWAVLSCDAVSYTVLGGSNLLLSLCMKP